MSEIIIYNTEDNKTKILDFIYKKWDNEEGYDGVFDYFNSKFETIAENAFKNLTKDIKKNNNKTPYIIRIAGQSGSGKTTQLMPAIKSNLDKKRQNYVLLAVRLFAKYHPNYNELLKKYGDGLIREKTNGFALLLLVRVLEKLIENKYNILFEVTLLEAIFEEYVVKISKRNDYKIHFNILSVNEKLSNNWISKRCNISKIEANRIVYKSSSSYFYEILPKALKKIIEIKKYFNENDRVVIWNAFEEKPCLDTNIFDENILKTFQKYRERIDFTSNSEDILKKSKIDFYEKCFDTL